MARLPYFFALIASVLFTACGGGEDSTPATGGGERADEVAVIAAWSEALTAGDIDGAAALFALPSVAANGVLVPIESERDARVFNESLPCGAELEDTEIAGKFITATFRLTTRRGVGACPGDGNTAQTTFVIEDGLIAEWRRVGLPDGDEDAGQAV